MKQVLLLMLMISTMSLFSFKSNENLPEKKADGQSVYFIAHGTNTGKNYYVSTLKFIAGKINSDKYNTNLEAAKTHFKEKVASQYGDAVLNGNVYVTEQSWREQDAFEEARQRAIVAKKKINYNVKEISL